MLNQLFKRTVFLAGLILVISMMFGMTVFASNENSRYIMDAEVMTSGHIGVLYIKGGTSSSGVISGGTLYFGKYDPVLKAWQDDLPVGEEASVAKEASLAIDSSGVCHVAYVTNDDKIAYVHTEGTGWSEPEIIESNNANGSGRADTLSCPDIAVDSNGKVHITYIDNDGAGDDYYAREDGMYATNKTGTFVKTVVANCTGWFSSPEGERTEMTKPIKIILDDSNNSFIAYRGTYWSKWMGGSDTSYYFEFRASSNTSRGTNSGGMIFEVCSDGTNYYTLISESGKYIVLDGNTDITDTLKETSIGVADMTLDGSDIYYAAINGTNLLFYQDGTFIDDKVATTGILSSHNKCATVIANDKQYIVYTGSDTDNSLVITTITDDEVDEFLVPNVTNYQVTIDPNNGDTTIPMSVEDGTEITLPSASSLTVPVGTAFAGWKIGDDIYDAGDTFVVESDITIEAQWYEIIETANCTITKPLAGANPDMTPVSADSDKYKVSLRYVYLYENTYPHLSGDDEYESGKTYSYRIRFTSEEGYIFTEDTTFTVNGDATSSYGRLDERELQYAVPITYIVTVDPNNGEDTQEISGLEIGTNNCQISSPTSYGFTIPDGYEFAGWKIEDVIYNAGEAFDVTGDMTAVAQWNPIEYQITYNLGEGIVSGVNPTTYTIESDNITLINPSKNDYYFAGWTGTGLSEPTQAVTIPQGSTGDREYTAQWIETTKITTITLDGEYVAPVVGETIPTITNGILSVNDNESLKDILDINYIKWQKRTGEEYWDFEDATGTFEAGEKYRLRMLFYVADESQSSYAFPSTTVTVNMTGTELSNWQKGSTSLGVWTEDVEPTVPAPTTYTVSYNANSGTGTKESEEVESGDTITLPSSDTFTAPKGYEFDSWDIIDEDANAVIEANKAPGYEYVVNKNIRIEAGWKIIEPASLVTAPVFENAEVGYSAIEKKAIEVKLTNKAVIKGDTVQLISSNTTNFNTICTLPNEELEGPATWNSASNFAIGPKNNLSAGTYTTTITIKAKGLDDNTYTLGEAEVSFTVTEPAPTIINTITFVGGNDFVAGNEVGTWTVPNDANYELTSSGTIFVKDLTANQTLTASDKYIGGHSYILVFTGVMPKTGFVYGNNDDLVFIADGVSVETTSEPQVMEQGIGRINFTVTEPAPTTFTVRFLAVDIADGEEIEGATLQVVDDSGNVITTWVSRAEEKEITGLSSGIDYTLKSTVAPDGYTLATDTSFTIDDEGRITSTGTVTESGTMLVEFAKTQVKVLAVKESDNSSLSNVTLQIVDGDGNVVEEWSSTNENHTIEGLIAGKEYTIKITEVPTGYEIPEISTFTIASDGEVTSTGNVTTEGVLLVSVSEAAPSTYTVTLNPNGGTVIPTSKEVTENGTYGELPTPTNEKDVEFLGWYKEKVVHDDNKCFDDTTVDGWVIRATPAEDMDYHNSGVHYFEVGDVLVFDITIDGLDDGIEIDKVDVNDQYLPGSDFIISANKQNIKGYTTITDDQYGYVLDFIDVEVTDNVEYTINEFALYKSKVTAADTIENSNHTLIAAWDTEAYSTEPIEPTEDLIWKIKSGDVVAESLPVEFWLDFAIPNKHLLNYEIKENNMSFYSLEDKLLFSINTDTWVATIADGVSTSDNVVYNITDEDRTAIPTLASYKTAQLIFDVEDEEVTYTVAYDVNGGTVHGGELTTRTVASGDTFTITKLFQMPDEDYHITVHAPENKWFDAFEISGERYEEGAKITITGNTVIKYLWKDITYVDKVELTIEAPVAGTKIEGEYDEVLGHIAHESINVRPEITLPEGADYTIESVETYWAASGDYNPYVGEIEAGKTYNAVVYIYCEDDSYQFLEEGLEVIVNGKKATTFDSQRFWVTVEYPMELVSQYLLKANVGEGVGNISVVPSGDEPDFEYPTTSVAYKENAGTKWLLAAKANEDYRFVNWTKSGDDTFTDTNSQITIELTEDVEYLANFELIEYNVTYDANGGTGTMSGETSKYYIFPSCDYTAPSGKTFDKWEVNGKTYKVGDTLTLTEDITVKATWKNKSTSSGGGFSSFSYKVTTRIENGTITPTNASVKKNADQEFTFFVADGYEITDVLVDGKPVGIVNSYKLEKVTSKHTIEVKTAKISAIQNVDDWAKEEMAKADEKGLIPETFAKKDATKAITRLDFAAVAVKLYEAISGKKAEPVAVNPFTDTSDDYVLKAYALGITKGTSETTFTPNAEITREQMATMMTRTLTKAGIDTSVDLNKVTKFVDDNEMHSWGKDSIYFMSEAGIINGISTVENRYRVTGNATIEQALLISERSAEKFSR